MDKISAQNLIKDTFNYPFNEEKFSKFSVNLLDQIKTNSSSVWLDNTNLPLPLRENVMQYKIFGQMEYENGEKIIISMIKLKSAEIVEKSRYIQRDFAKWLIDKNDSDACLISFFTDNYDDWRFSLVKIDYKREETKTGKIKVKQELTPLRRYSYLVGKNEPNHTAQTQLAPLLEKENVNMNDIIDAFSVEKVTKEFFDNYKNLCFEIIKDIKNLKLKDKKIKEEFRINNIDEYDFAKKVMSQIVFLYFLQKRGLLGIKKDKNNAYKQWGTGSKNFIRELFDQKHKKYNNFYNDILEPLFFEGLARERDEDNFAFLDCKIPFLNGGLFERYYNWSETYLILSNDIIKKIFDTFDRFNFTVVEEDPVDKEVAIDPEILGKVFESLIDIKERKKQGIFYTPREIVNFMCKETLSNFIFSQLEEQGIKYDKSRIGVLLDHNHNFWLTNTKINIEKETLIFIYEKLKNIKICDPAIGSGAFQLGMLNKLVFALKKLRESTSKYQVSDYRLKKNIIQKNLYGVDIENSSVEIGRLRLWLSLIIEDESVKKLEPLPNLEYKIVKGNSLSAVKENLFNSSYLEKLIPLKEEYFFEANFSRKTKLKNNIIQIEKNLGIENNFDFKLNFAELFKKSSKNQGFDIIIGNPPYIGEQGNKDIFRAIKNDESNSLRIFYEGRMDYFYFFLHQGINIAKNKGQIAFITTNYYLTATAGKKIRNDIKERCNILFLINFNELKIFDTARGIHNMITILQKNTGQKNLAAKTIVTKREGFAGFKILDLILNGKDNLLTNYSEINQKELYKTKDNYIFLKSEKSIEKQNLIENILLKLTKNSLPLSKYFNINQGTLSGCDNLSKNHFNNLKNKKNFKINDGIFVLDHNNERDKNVIKTFNKNEKKYLKNFYKNSDIFSYNSNTNPQKSLLYLTWKDNIEQLPNIKNHLYRFKEILSKRLKTYNENHPWYALHRPRNKNIFTDPKIVAPYRSKLNTFAYNEVEWFCRSDCYVITKKSDLLSMKTLLCVLNSKLFYLWLYSRGKRKGNLLELFSKPLSEIPIKIFDKKLQKEIESSFEKIIKIFNPKNYKKNDFSQEQLSIKNNIDDIIFKAYNLSKEEVKFVNNFYIENI